MRESACCFVFMYFVSRLLSVNVWQSLPTSMRQPDMEACGAGRTGQGVFVNGAFCGNTHKPFTGLIIHTTTVQCALDIICEGYIKGSEGAAGFGVYGFELADSSNEVVIDK